LKTVFVVKNSDLRKQKKQYYDAACFAFTVYKIVRVVIYDTVDMNSDNVVVVRDVMFHWDKNMYEITRFCISDHLCFVTIIIVTIM